MDLPDECAKIGISDAVSDAHESEVEQTRRFIEDRLGGAVQLHSRAEFPAVIAGLTNTLPLNAGERSPANQPEQSGRSRIARRSGVSRYASCVREEVKTAVDFSVAFAI